jgi:hypothetical protein
MNQNPHPKPPKSVTLADLWEVTKPTHETEGERVSVQATFFRTSKITIDPVAIKLQGAHLIDIAKHSAQQRLIAPLFDEVRDKARAIEKLLSTKLRPIEWHQDEPFRQIRAMLIELAQWGLEKPKGAPTEADAPLAMKPSATPLDGTPKPCEDQG